MVEISPPLQRWHRLPRADRKAILARLSADQRSDLLAMIATNAEGETPNSTTQAINWALFSPRMATILRSIEDRPEAAHAAHSITAGAAQLLLETAREMRAGQLGGESRTAALRRRWQNWVKELDL